MSVFTFVQLVVLAAGAASADPVTVQWDPDIADDIKRGGYDVLVVQTINEAAGAVSRTLGVPLKSPIQATVYAPRSYEKIFGPAKSARWWAQYSEQKIHINGGVKIDGSFKGLLVHELTHAVLDSNRNGGRIDPWMNEGLAEFLEREAIGRGTIDTMQRILLRDALRNHDIGTLTAIRQPLGPNDYLESFAAVSLLMQLQGRTNVLQFYQNVANGTKPEEAWKKLGTDPNSFVKAFEAWVADFRG